MKLVLGLGGIGGNMALRMIDAGMTVIGLDPDPNRARSWRSEAGQPAYTTAEEVPWQAISQVVVAVRTEVQLDDVLQELSGRLGDRPAGIVVVTTISAARAARLGHGLPPSWRVLEAPVSGGEAAARRGSLTWFTHGPRRTEEEDRLVATLCGAEYRFDQPGQATLVKLMNNTLAAYNARGMALAMSMAEAAGVPGEVLLDAVGKSSGASFAGDHLLQLSDNQLDLLDKDAGLLGIDSATRALVQHLDGWREDLARVRAGRGAGESAL